MKHYTVMQWNIDNMYHVEDEFRGEVRGTCGCFDKADAQKIADALNLFERTNAATAFVNRVSSNVKNSSYGV